MSIETPVLSLAQSRQLDEINRRKAAACWRAFELLHHPQSGAKPRECQVSPYQGPEHRGMLVTENVEALPVRLNAAESLTLGFKTFRDLKLSRFGLRRQQLARSDSFYIAHTVLGQRQENPLTLPVERMVGSVLLPQGVGLDPEVAKEEADQALQRYATRVDEFNLAGDTLLRASGIVLSPSTRLLDTLRRAV